MLLTPVPRPAIPLDGLGAPGGYLPARPDTARPDLGPGKGVCAGGSARAWSPAPRWTTGLDGQPTLGMLVRMKDCRNPTAGVVLLQSDIDCARDGATAGARAVTSQRGIIADAADMTVDALISAALAGKSVRNVRRWAWAVGRNFARSLLSRRQTVSLCDLDDPADAMSIRSAVADALDLVARIVTLVQAESVRLTRKQRAVLAELRPRDSLKANARYVGMAPFSLRRMLRSVGRRALHTKLANEGRALTVAESELLHRNHSTSRVAIGSNPA